MIRFLRFMIGFSVIGIGLMAYFIVVTIPGDQRLEEVQNSKNRLALMENRLRGSKISDFSFVNQYGKEITQNHVLDKIYIVDFFFTSCPTICPIMGGHKQRIQDYFQDEDDLVLISHSIDTMNDSVPVLREYANRINAIPDKWHLVTGDSDSIFNIAKEYYVTAQIDDLESGSFVHDGSFILVDKKRNVRGIYDGTDTASTSDLITDIETLLNYD